MVKRKEEKEIMIYEIIHTNLKIEQTPTQQKHGETHVHVEGRDFPGWSTRCTRCVALATNPAISHIRVNEDRRETTLH
jgi:hypothetical protein